MVEWIDIVKARQELMTKKIEPTEIFLAFDVFMKLASSQPSWATNPNTYNGYLKIADNPVLMGMRVNFIPEGIHGYWWIMGMSSHIPVFEGNYCKQPIDSCPAFHDDVEFIEHFKDEPEGRVVVKLFIDSEERSMSLTIFKKLLKLMKDV